MQSFGNLTASAVAGALWTLISPEAAFIYAAACMVTALVLFVVLRARRGTRGSLSPCGSGVNPQGSPCEWAPPPPDSAPARPASTIDRRIEAEPLGPLATAHVIVKQVLSGVPLSGIARSWWAQVSLKPCRGSDREAGIGNPVGACPNRSVRAGP